MCSICFQPQEIKCRRSQTNWKMSFGHLSHGIILKPDLNQSFLVWANANFVGNWDPDTAIDDVMTAKSRLGSLITYSGCPISWASKMQTEIALSTTESAHSALPTGCVPITVTHWLPFVVTTRYTTRSTTLQPRVRHPQSMLNNAQPLVHAS